MSIYEPLFFLHQVDLVGFVCAPPLASAPPLWFRAPPLASVSVAIVAS